MTGFGSRGRSRRAFTPERLSLDLTKLSPLAGLKRMFGIDGLTTLVKGLVKMAMVGVVLWMELWPERTRLEPMLGQSPMAIASDMMELLFKIALATLLVLGVIASFDFFIQRMRSMRRNRMSKQEIKEEFRQTEGDPMVKARVRQIRQERAKCRMIAAVKRATVVVTTRHTLPSRSPTNQARWTRDLRGQGRRPTRAAHPRGGRGNAVPIVENPPLARALYSAVELDEEIPPEHYKARGQGHRLRHEAHGAETRN